MRTEKERKGKERERARERGRERERERKRERELGESLQNKNIVFPVTFFRTVLKESPLFTSFFTSFINENIGFRKRNYRAIEMTSTVEKNKRKRANFSAGLAPHSLLFQAERGSS